MCDGQQNLDVNSREITSSMIACTIVLHVAIESAYLFTWEQRILAQCESERPRSSGESSHSAWKGWLQILFCTLSHSCVHSLKLSCTVCMLTQVRLTVKPSEVMDGWACNLELCEASRVSRVVGG